MYRLCRGGNCMNIKRSGLIIAIFVITLLSAGIFNSGCYLSDDETRVTIKLQRNDLGMNNYIPEKRMIDKVLEFFSTPAYAMSWDDTIGDLTLTVSSSSFNDMTFSIPSDAVTYSLVVPAVSNVTFEITSITGYGLNWGGHITLSLNPGEQEIAINMVPITKIISVNDYSDRIDISWDMVSYAGSYKIYRATAADGPYSLIGTIGGTFYQDDSSGMVPGTEYYYRISVEYLGNEGVMCNSVSCVWEGIY